MHKLVVKIAVLQFLGIIASLVGSCIQVRGHFQSA